MRGLVRVAGLAALLAVGAAAAEAQLAVSANDAKVKLVDGKVQVIPNPPPDTVSFIDLRASPPKVLAEISIANSVIGPPTNVAVSPKEEFVLVATAQQIDPTDPTKTIPDQKLTVIDITPLRPGFFKKLVSKETPAPKILATHQAGKGASGIAINKAGTLALVANRAEGTVSVFAIAGMTLTAQGNVTVGGEKSGPSAVAFTPDGKSAFVTLDGDHKIVMLSVDGSKVQVTKRVISAGLRPYGFDVSAKGEVAVVANIGMGGGDADTISIIDLKLDPPRVVNTYTVGQTPEGIKMSPDGKYVAVTVVNGSNRAADSPFYNANSLLQVWVRNGTQLTKAGEVPIGKWCQGIAWASNGRTLLAQCMVEEEVHVVRFSGLTGRSLQKVGTVKTKGGPAGIGTAQP